MRANGAFSVWGLEVFNEHKQIYNYEYIEKYVEELLMQCDTELLSIVNKYDCDFMKFIEYSKTVEKPGLYNYNLAEMLFWIKEHDYIKARDMAVYELENGRYGHFKNKGKDIYEHIINFCVSKL